MSDRFYTAQGVRRCRFCFRPLKARRSRAEQAGPCCRAKYTPLLEFEEIERQGQLRLNFPDRTSPVGNAGGNHEDDSETD